MYIDQPIGTGFSFGTVDVNSTFASSPAIWTAFQILFESQEFAKYQSREFIFATESYGGHYGPEFVTYFNQQNALIKSGALKGELVEVSALMINKCVFSFSFIFKCELGWLTRIYGGLKWVVRSPHPKPGVCRLRDVRAGLWAAPERHHTRGTEPVLLRRRRLQGPGARVLRGRRDRREQQDLQRGRRLLRTFSLLSTQALSRSGRKTDGVS